MRLLPIMLTASMLSAAPALRYASDFWGEGDDAIARVVLDSAGNIYIAARPARLTCRSRQESCKAGGWARPFCRSIRSRR